MSADRWFKLDGYIEPCRNKNAHEGVCVRATPCALKCMCPPPGNGRVETPPEPAENGS